MISVFGIPYTIIFDTKKKPLPPKPKPKPKPTYHDYSDKLNYSKFLSEKKKKKFTHPEGF
jgi:hypothetical protein